ncbi:hypothetical protein ACS126_09975 [Sphingobacterium lactis]|uniref:hypothetical protein n=1 Tax=Sphingobacterium lactis TaxID=797291 RepID=UPI003EC8A7AE
MKIKGIYNAAYAAGACRVHGLDLIEKAQSIEDVIYLMKSPQGTEFCMKNSFPSKDMLLDHTADFVNKNVFVEGVHEVLNPDKVLVFGGYVTIRTNGYNACEVYATNDAVVSLIADEYSFTTIELHGNAKAIGGSNKNAIVRVFNHTNKVDV